jgi:murein DD-endopeptidase MepM/ murein hydrolase activator NlpD
MPGPVRHAPRRLLVVLAVAAVAALGAVLAHPGAAGSSASGARAVVLSAGSSDTGAVSVGSARTDNTASASPAAPSATLSFGSATATVSSFVTGSTLTSTSEATVTGISLFGRITADSVHVQAKASATTAAVAASLPALTVTGLAVDGTPVTPGDSVPVSSLGTLTSLVHGAPDASGSSSSAAAVGIRLTLDTATAGYPAGTVIEVGSVSAAADQPTLQSLVHTSSPTPTPTWRSPTPTPTPSHSVVPTYNPSLPPTQTYPPMPAPSPASAAVLARFPGAVFPVVGRCYYSDDFGGYRADIPSHSHEGNDIFAPAGAPVVAVQDGTVTLSTTTIGGNNVHLTTGLGDYFYYAHFSGFAAGLQSGSHVVAGQTIGYVGTTGDAQGTSPHCHFEIHPGGGAAVDPYPYLEAWRLAGHVITTGTDENGQTVSGGFDPSLLSQYGVPGQGTVASPAALTGAGLAKVAGSLGGLDATLQVGAGHPLPRNGSSGADAAGMVFLVLNTAGAVLLKRLQVAALLL